MSPEHADAVAKRDALAVALRALVAAVEAERRGAFDIENGCSDSAYREAYAAFAALDDAIDRALEALGDPPLHGEPKTRPF